MKQLFLLFALITTTSTFAQVGINTTSPNAIVEIKSSSETNPTITDGILIPRMDVFPPNPTVNQDGMLIYISGDDPSPIPDEEGYYYWDFPTLSWIPFSVKRINDLQDGRSDWVGSNYNGASVYLGNLAGANDDGTSNRSVGIGQSALQNNTAGTGNTAIGHSALFNMTIGQANTAIGRNAMFSSTNANGNTAIGFAAMYNNTEGSNNLAIGSETLQEITDQDFNTAIGFKALQAAVSDGNTAIGANALENLTTGSNNMSFGYSSLSNLTTGSNNLNIGNLGLSSLTGGESNNIAIGIFTGFNNSGDNNIYLGNTSGSNFINATARSGGIFLGNGSGQTETSSNRLYIENSASSTPLIGGDFALDRVGINRDLSLLTNTFEVEGEASKTTVGAWLGNSDRRLKKNIETIKGNEALAKISKLRGVTYQWNDTETGNKRPTTIQYGFIAQEIMEVFPNKVSKDVQGYYQTAYGDYDAIFVQAIKELIKLTHEQKQEIKTLKEQNDVFEMRLKKLEAAMPIKK
ncbi:hypothetical protein G5B37_12825 [Rasiella rasia]|uniref:Peptidase S74 domain-containing protein n=1 Tax=Rasiella rasia TaxID=2744027 RepID=A0A6G6GPQ7_9FLAO|nr:tail fiber domain-containing protein [Rasiella rasia]QIE60413.1 hypothetical protein G5B37_12825 [Rasiella rasia]